MKSKSIIMALVLILTLTCTGFAQEATTEEPQGFSTLGLLAIGQDNLFLAQSGQSAFAAIGAGVDFARWEKPLSSKGSTLSLTLHATAAAKVTGDEKGQTLVGGSVNLDLIKLLTGTGITFLTKDITCVVGPVVVYDISKGKPAYGGLINLSYTF